MRKQITGQLALLIFAAGMAVPLVLFGQDVDIEKQVIIRLGAGPEMFFCEDSHGDYLLGKPFDQAEDLIIFADGPPVFDRGLGSFGPTHFAPQLGGGHGAQSADEQQRYRMQHSRRLAMVKMWQLADYLELSDDQVDQLLPIFRAHQKETDAHWAKSREVYQAYTEKLDAGNVGKKDIDKFLDEMAKLDKERSALKTRHIKKFDGILNDDQMARFVIFEERFRGELRKQIIIRKGSDTIRVPKNPEK